MTGKSMRRAAAALMLLLSYVASAIAPALAGTSGGSLESTLPHVPDANGDGKYSPWGSAAAGAPPVTASTAGSAGLDYSANKPTLPNVGANFAASGPYASYVLVATVPASPTRNAVEIDNNSGAQIVVVRDDGTAASSAAPVNASVFALVGASGAGAQGGWWSNRTFKGRLQIYAPSASAQVAVMVD